MPEKSGQFPDTAFPETMGKLADMVAEITLDLEALSLPVRSCDLSECRGTCCHDGAYLSSEEAEVIRNSVEANRETFSEIGIDLPAQVVVYGKCRDIASGPKTATRPAPMRKRVSDYPGHFPETNCVFLHPQDARCGLQLLAAVKGLPKWYFKPATCWMHPLSISKDNSGKPVLTLYNETSDPQKFPDYDGFVCRTPCGRECTGGRPAIEVLHEEIKMILTPPAPNRV